MKILLTLNAPTPYRIDFCNELGSYVDLTVTYERQYSRDRKKSWQTYCGNKTFKEVYLNGLKINNEMGICPSIINFLKKNCFDVIIIGGYSTPTGMMAIQYLSMKNIPFILNTDGGMKKNDPVLKYNLKRYFISKASKWLSTSKITDEYLQYYGASQNEIIRYPLTPLHKSDILDPLVCHAQKNKHKLELNLIGEKIVVSIGRFIYGKGFDLLLNAMANLQSNVSLYIIGGKPTKEYLSIIEEKKLVNIYFVDFQSKEIIKKYLIASDLFVLPTRGDAWGMVINEALSCGCPVITTDKCIAGLELISNNVNGYIVPSDNIKELQETMRNLLDNDFLLKEMRLNAINSIKEYTIENMALVHLNLLLKINENGWN